MLVKVLTLIIVVLAAALLLAGRGRLLPARRGSASPARLPRAHDLAKCAGCGVWLPPGQNCDCRRGAG